MALILPQSRLTTSRPCITIGETEKMSRRPQLMLRFMLHLHCPNPECRRALKVSESSAGQTLTCPACKHAVKIPRADMLPPISPASPHVADANNPTVNREDGIGDSRSTPTPRPAIPLLLHLPKQLVRCGLERVRIFKVQRQIAGLDAAIRTELLVVGNRVLSGEDCELSLDSERRKLDEIKLALDDHAFRLSALQGTAGTADLLREVRRQIFDLECKRNDVVAEVGQLALENGNLDEASSRKLKSLQAIVIQCRDRLLTLQSALSSAQHNVGRLEFASCGVLILVAAILGCAALMGLAIPVINNVNNVMNDVNNVLTLDECQHIVREYMYAYDVKEFEEIEWSEPEAGRLGRQIVAAHLHPNDRVTLVKLRWKPRGSFMAGTSLFYIKDRKVVHIEGDYRISQ